MDELRCGLLRRRERLDMNVGQGVHRIPPPRHIRLHCERHLPGLQISLLSLKLGRQFKRLLTRGHMTGSQTSGSSRSLRSMYLTRRTACSMHFELSKLEREEEQQTFSSKRDSMLACLAPQPLGAPSLSGTATDSFRSEHQEHGYPDQDHDGAHRQRRRRRGPGRWSSCRACRRSPPPRSGQRTRWRR